MAKTREWMLVERERYSENFIDSPECNQRFPGWLDGRGPNGHVYSSERDAFICRFQDALRLVAMKPDPENPGQMIPDFDRVIIREAPHIHVVPYDVDEDGTYWIGLVYQFRHFIEGEIPPICADIPMGFNLSRVLGNGAQEVFESADEAAARELAEELGVPVRERPVYIRTMVDHTTYGAQTTTPIYKAKVKRELVTGATDEKEGLMSEMITLAEYGRRVREGIDQDGILWGFGLSQGTLSFFLQSEGAEAARQFYGG